jgi:hypothetical protein
MPMRSTIVAIVVAASMAACSPAYAPAPVFQRGDLVRVLPPSDVKGDPKASRLVLKVVAIPNDRLSVHGSTLYVNDVTVTGFGADFLGRVANAPERVPSVVPAGHYFVMGDQRSTDGVGEYWGQQAGVRLYLAH